MRKREKNERGSETKSARSKAEESSAGHESPSVVLSTEVSKFLRRGGDVARLDQVELEQSSLSSLLDMLFLPCSMMGSIWE